MDVDSLYRRAIRMLRRKPDPLSTYTERRAWQTPHNSSESPFTISLSYLLVEGKLKP